MKTNTVFAALLILLFASLRASAQKDPVYVAPVITGDSIHIGKTMIVKDSVFYDPALKPSIKYTNYINNLVSLRLNEYATRVLPDSFQLSVTVSVIYSDSLLHVDGAVHGDSITNKVLTIEYNSKRAYSNKAVFYFKNAHYAEVRITGITATYGSLSTILPLVEMENRMVIDRGYTMDCVQNAIGAITIDTSTVSGTGELKISWPYSNVSDAYDVEWTYIDSSALANGVYNNGGSLDPNLLFRNNATRITTKSNTCMIPLLYDGTGTLFFRVRGTQLDQNGELQTTQWNTQSDTDPSHWRYDYLGHERNLNWQATTTFAEEGKRKSVVQYFDGSLRGRQVVTRDNTTQTTVVAETLYDKQGRPVIQVMPAPTLSTLIHYTPNFNVADMQGSEYGKDKYDPSTSTTNYCGKGADSMSVVSGASNYYSPLNPLAASGFHQFIPNAKKFPFTQTQYTQDNTGRIYRQGGVDSIFQIGTGQETLYYYITPDQPDLDALFGTEVGDASHYQKNMVRDANGQYSVSYVDMHGRTIATALAGIVPPSMQQLSSYRDSVQTMEMLSSTNNLLHGGAYQFSKSIMMTRASDVTLHYSMGKQSLKLADCRADSICYDCLYDLTIKVSGDCSGQVSGKNDTTITLSNFPLWRVDTTCGLATPIDKTINLSLGEGTYNITKILSINREGMNKYRDSVYLARNTCFSFDDFFKKQMQAVKDSLHCPQDSLKEPYYTIYREQMLEDLRPLQGQYADTTTKWSNPNLDRCYSIFDLDGGDGKTLRYQTVGNYLDENGNPDLVYNSAGNLVSPKDLSVNEFISQYKDSWGEALLPLHPEYKLLQVFESFTDSHSWDEDFENTDTYSAALAKGYLNPTGSASTPANKFTAGSDPLFAHTGTASAKSTLEQTLFHYKTGLQPGVDLTLWGMATAAAKCSDPVSQSCLVQYNQSANLFNTDSLCTGDLDMAWRIFRNIYLQNKRSWFDSYMRLQASVSYPTAPCTPVFANFSHVMSSDGFTGTDKQTDSTRGRDSLNQFYRDNCKGYRLRWAQQLANCGYSQVQMDTILNRLENICREGADEKHPYGASTVKPSSLNPSPYRSFTETIAQFNSTIPGKATDVNCSGASIDMPLPYEQQQFYVQQPVWTKPDNCTCTKINDFYNQYLLQTTAYSSFSDYMLKNYQTSIAESTLDSLRNFCNGNIQCKYLPKPLSLPPVLQCDITSPCITCAQYSEAYKSFTGQYHVTPTFSEDDTVQQQINRVFANYMNQRFGFHKLSIEYLEYMQQCDSSGAALKDSLNGLVADFQDYYSALAKGQIFQYYKISDAAIAIVDAANALVKARHNLPLPAGYALIPYNNDFTAPLRGVSPYRTNNYAYNVVLPLPLQYTALGVSMPDLQNNTVLTTDFAALPVTKKQLNTKYWATSFGDEGTFFRNMWDYKYYNYYYGYGLSTPLLKYLPATPNNSENHVYSATFFDIPSTVTDATSFQNFYYNNISTSSGFSSYVNNTANIKGIKNLRFATEFLPFYDMGPFRDNAQALKVTLEMTDGTEKDAFMYANYDNTGYLRYKDFIDSNLYSSDCNKAFTYYFNLQNSTHYSITQVDSIYTASGLNLDPCGPLVGGPTGPTLCGKAEPMNIEAVLNNDPCADSTNLAMAGAVYHYQYYQDSLINSFNEAYQKRCLNIRGMESFTMTRPVSEYHYTLYYYDQAGNLVKTVPPEGVHPNRDVQWLNDVQQKRAQGQWQVPQHTLVTTYRYNSLNQVVSQKTPDAGTSQFWYDRLGRLAVSQNAKQRAVSHYSYTLYDAIGRITEVGEKPHALGLSNTVSRDPVALNKWIQFRNFDQAYYPVQVTATYYDVVSSMASVYAPPVTLFHQKDYTLRNRVSSTRYYDLLEQRTSSTSGGDTTYFSLVNTFVSGVDYSYDIHGNVDTMLNMYSKGSIMSQTAHKTNQFKLIAYKYDLISGKVNEVHYQPGANDEFYHRYEYDADNRLTAVYTADVKAFLGQQGLEEREATYQYYKHGPLARTVLGQQKVQGLDYAYTLQGWLKGVNSTSLNPLFDMGGDGGSGSINRDVARDAYGYSLNYFTGEYFPITGQSPFAGHSGKLPSGQYRPLYNGNISSMMVNLGGSFKPLVYNYQYDQLNRLVAMDSYKELNAIRGLNQAINQWDTLVNTGEYKERIAYDANGNILKYLRQGYGSNLNMDSLTYNYNQGTNQLNYIRDQVNGSSTAYKNNYTTDLEDQALNNYSYDEIGNLTKDGINLSNIKWSVYGKILHMDVRPVVIGDATAMDFFYDPMGNRIGKSAGHYQAPSSYLWYVRDAQGNVMAVYQIQNNPDFSAGPLKLIEQDIYGSSRIGVIQRNMDADQPRVAAINANLIGNTYTYSLQRGVRNYELSNHLGNVLTTITDQRKGIDTTGDGVIDYYMPVVVSSQDYYPFGMQMPGRTVSASTYRYGFNGKEKDSEIKGEGNQYDYGMRIYDPRAGRFLSTDPLSKKYPELTPYQFASNSPIQAIDLDGKEANVVTRRHNSDLDKDNLESGENSGLISPLSAETLIKWAMQARGEKQETWRSRVTAGNILEYAYEEWLQVDRNPNITLPTTARKADVKPDFIMSSSVDGGEIGFTNFPMGTFIEVKGGAKEISLGLSNNQILGELDALSKQRSTLGQVKAADVYALNFVLVLPQGAKIGKDVRNKANELHIKLWATYAYQNLSTGGIIFSNLNLVNNEILNKIPGPSVLSPMVNGLNSIDKGAFIKDWGKVMREEIHSNEQPSQNGQSTDNQNNNESNQKKE